jgi:hypothetical protein
MPNSQALKKDCLFIFNFEVIAYILRQAEGYSDHLISRLIGSEVRRDAAAIACCMTQICVAGPLRAESEVGECLRLQVVREEYQSEL